MAGRGPEVRFQKEFSCYWSKLCRYLSPRMYDCSVFIYKSNKISFLSHCHWPWLCSRPDEKKKKTILLCFCLSDMLICCQSWKRKRGADPRWILDYNNSCFDQSWLQGPSNQHLGPECPVGSDLFLIKHSAYRFAKIEFNTILVFPHYSMKTLTRCAWKRWSRQLESSSAGTDISSVKLASESQSWSLFQITNHKSPGTAWTRASVPSADRRWLEGRQIWRISSGWSPVAPFHYLVG